MEFWGAEVKSGEPLVVNLGQGKVLHLSQACLGEVKKDKGKESVSLNLNIDGKKLVLGTLNSDKLPQQLFDLVFDKRFELSHTWKNGSVYFYGYTAPNHDDQDDDDDTDSDSEEDIPLQVSNNGKQEKPPTPVVENANAVKESAAGKKVKIVEPKKDAEDEDSSDDSDAMSEDESDSEEDSEDLSDDVDDDEDSDEDEETPKKAESSKKRPSSSEFSTKTPVPSKKAKVVTPQKTDGKKGGVHVATPHPTKKAGKTAVTAATTSNKSNQSPKSEGSHSCKTCNRSFKSDSALDSHNKAKHSSGK